MPFAQWPQQPIPGLSIQEMYERGYAGAVKQEGAREQLRDLIVSQGGYVDAADACRVFHLEGSGAGKLSLPFLAINQCWPNALPGPAQTTGDCVSWGTKNACLVTLAVEIVNGKPDEQTGKVEGQPEISAEGERNGVIATEPIYGDRGHSGEGASCERLAQHVVEWGGLMLRMNYPDLNLDFTKYDSKIGTRWGGSGTPENVKSVAKQHQVRTATETNSIEEIRDLLANGYGVNSCGGEGWSNKRNEDGVSERSGSWAHSMAYIGFDDRDEVKRKYNGPLVLVQNSWAEWNSGGRRILGTNIDIPHGSFWARASDISRRYGVAFSSINGWPPRKIPHWITILG